MSHETEITKRKPKDKSEKSSERNKQATSDSDNDNKKHNTPKYGPLPRFPGQRVWSRAIVIFGVLIYVWYTSKSNKETTLAKQSEIYDRRTQNVECDVEYLKEIEAFPGCVPIKCGRCVSDKLITSYEADVLLNVALKGIAFGGSSGGASILDLHSGALSYGEKFINIYSIKSEKKFVTAADLAVYKLVRSKIQKAIASNFGLDENSLHLTHPTFFSKLTNVEAKTPHDEYWHVHIDKVTYESFHYTSLLYLNDYNKDFEGGRFMFLDDLEKPKKNITVEPRKGRVSMFTSGAENPHFVERVTKGTRYAITVSFTCDKSKAISDPLMS